MDKETQSTKEVFEVCLIEQRNTCVKNLVQAIVDLKYFEVEKQSEVSLPKKEAVERAKKLDEGINTSNRRINEWRNSLIAIEGVLNNLTPDLWS